MAKIPPQAKKVFEGIIYDVYHWEQEVYDGTTQTFEMLKRAATLLVIAVTEDKKILLLDEEQPSVGRFVNFPGGRMEKNETSYVDGTKRELLEETGYTSDDFEVYIEENEGSKIDWPFVMSIARGCKKVSEPQLDPGEKIHEILHLTFEEFYETVLANSFRDKKFQEHFRKIVADPIKLEEFKEKLYR